ncbi:Bug family tripartite tricarboxylate transporter substrate binding protein [Allosalinactinospora lopnorensis]|uniref:Bug family tripartite tricarboxylate transporter substrate binding protein n=1 Tax=Allosalinactinospora lopnorensis TaxID=1352348 RepID=UPI000623FB9D|nr:tripartite tricarboxylate transporter substrate binding protein [Allosalinactinospora lopnorensis]
MFRAPRLITTAAAGASVVLLSTACGGSGGQNADGGWSPERPIELIAPAETGGGWDTLARTTSRVLEEEEMVDQNLQVENKPGGGGAIGWAHVANTPDDPHKLFVTSPPIILVPLSGNSDHTHEDFTPIAALATEYMAYVVPEDSPLESFEDLVEQVEEDPESISIAGGSGPGSMDHVALAGAVKAAGGDPKELNYVPHDGGGEALTSMVGGHVDAAVTGISEAAGMVESDDARMLATSAPEPTDAAPDTPTLQEEGIDFDFDIWRGVMGPGEMTEGQVAYYERLFADMVEQDSWKEETGNLGWEQSYMDSEEFGTFLDEAHAESGEILDEVGLGTEQG